jgi:hypothetical protein
VVHGRDEPSVPAPTLLRLPGAYVLWIAAGILLLAALYLQPLAGFAFFGSDTGEYYRLTTLLTSTGHLPVGGSYGGWGIGYPDFPGLFVLTAATSQSTGVDPLTALVAVVPLLSAFSIAPLFLLFRRIFPSDSVALLGAAFACVAMPRAFSMAHPAPLALGDLLGVAALWMFVEGRNDARWYLPLSVTGTALILSHHLSSYFFLVGALGSLVALELFRPNAWSSRFPSREIAFLVAFLLGLDVYWFAFAPDFVADVVTNSHLFGLSAPAIGLALAVGAILLGLLTARLLRWRRRHPYRSMRVSFPSDRSVLRDGLLIATAMFGGVAVLLVVPLPGTTQSATVGQILFFVPILGLVGFAAGTRRLTSDGRIGPFALAWLLAIGGSAIFGIVSQSPVILPSRHAEYLLIPVGLLVGLSVARFIARAHDIRGRRAAAAVVLGGLLLLAANAAIVYPPPQFLGGFQEGTTPRDLVLGMWTSNGLPPGTVVATDHRLSSLLFGFDGTRATWDSTPALFTGSDATNAGVELRGALAPHTLLPVDAIALDGTMRTVGVALSPSDPALPISGAALEWFQHGPFVPLYENQNEAVYWVSGPLPIGVPLPDG